MFRRTLIVGLLVFAALLNCGETRAQDKMSGANAIESAARNFVIPKRSCQSVQFDSMTVAGLDSMGWSGLLPFRMDDTCLVVRVSLMEIEGEMVYSLVDPPPGTRPLIPVMASIHAFIRASDLQPLFAVTGRYWDISREVVPLSLDSVIGIVGRQTSLGLRVPRTCRP